MSLWPSYIELNYPILSVKPPKIDIIKNFKICIKLIDSRSAFRVYNLSLNIARNK